MDATDPRLVARERIAGLRWTLDIGYNRAARVFERMRRGQRGGGQWGGEGFRAMDKLTPGDFRTVRQSQYYLIRHPTVAQR